MAQRRDPGELELVRLAISSAHVTGCCEWDEKASRRFFSQPAIPGLTPEGVKSLLYDFVTNNKGAVVQVEECRPEYDDRSFYYKAIIPVEGLVHGLFVEIILDDDDPDLPSVRIVNAHKQTR